MFFAHCAMVENAHLNDKVFAFLIKFAIPGSENLFDKLPKPMGSLNICFFFRNCTFKKIIVNDQISLTLTFYTNRVYCLKGFAGHMSLPLV